MSFPPRIACGYSRSLGKKEGRKEEAKTPCSRVIHERGRARESGEAFPASFLPRSFLPSFLSLLRSLAGPDLITAASQIRYDSSGSFLRSFVGSAPSCIYGLRKGEGEGGKPPGGGVFREYRDLIFSAASS